MIVADRKPFREIMEMIDAHARVLLLACNACVTVCAAGGTREAAVLASEIRLARMKDGRPVEVKEMTLERNCDPEYVLGLKDAIGGYDAVLSMACGCGVQAVAEAYPGTPVLPAVNTTFEGVTVEQGVWAERCQGCGNCMLHRTSGVCPVARCAKSLLNGPCGGSSEGRCEVDPDTPCVWQIIVDRLKMSGSLESYLRIEDPKDWSFARDGGPRRRVREDMRL